MSQYFTGSAYAWLEDTKVKCHNLVPMELTTKICDKIALGKPEHRRETRLSSKHGKENLNFLYFIGEGGKYAFQLLELDLCSKSLFGCPEKPDSAHMWCSLCIPRVPPHTTTCRRCCSGRGGLSILCTPGYLFIVSGYRYFSMQFCFTAIQIQLFSCLCRNCKCGIFPLKMVFRCLPSSRIAQAIHLRSQKEEEKKTLASSSQERRRWRSCVRPRPTDYLMFFCLDKKERRT